MRETFSSRMKQAMNLRNELQVTISEKTGIPKSAISQYLSGRNEPKQQNIYRIALALDVDEAWLMGFDVPMERQESHRKTQVSVPSEAIEGTVSWEELPEEMGRGAEEYLSFTVKDDSMSPAYLHGDVLSVLKKPEYKSGDDCIVMINGQDATFKRVILLDNGLLLYPLNPAYEPVYYDKRQVSTLPITIVGVVVALQRFMNQSFMNEK